MTGTLRVLLGDQLNDRISALDGIDPRSDRVLMMEVMDECTYVRHHPQKITLILSAMRHFAAALRARGFTVEYVDLDEPANTHTLSGEVARACARLSPAALVATEPGEWRVLDAMRRWQEQTGIETDIRIDTRFLCRLDRFRAWAHGRRSLRMEFFYREMRRQTGLLIDQDGAPVGGSWNYDAENRKRLPATAHPPAVPRFPPDPLTRQVMQQVAARFAGHFGSNEAFGWPVTRAEAQQALADFINVRLAHFGDWQDAMKQDTPFLWHAMISTSLNCGLLLPLEVCEAAAAAYQQGRVPLNAAEGFIRQVLGWREFVRGIYWLLMPHYATRNGLAATRPLPEFYWTGQTRMHCLAQSIRQTQTYAYAHHIQRLMVLGNFALLAAFHPDAVDEWYLIVFADAYQWVEMPNVRGMVLHADHGVVGSKPYAASGAYIDRMSDYCRSCFYDVRDATGPRACPFNALYWDFIARHAASFAANPRMAMPVRNWTKMPAPRQAALRARAASLLAALDAGEPI